MDWVRENWVFLLFAALFIWMHFSGHGGMCGGGHRGHGTRDEGHEEHSSENRNAGSKGGHA